jgi:hypothetical protein
VDRARQIVDVLVEAFEDLIEADPRAFRRKFRKMAQDPFSFYRGSACLFYADVAEMEDRYADERTSRVWIQGDLHAENYGTYLNDAGILVFDVNDFDEAYLGHFTWDLRRMAASLALLGFAKALSDEAIERMIATYGRAYLAQVRAFATGDRDSEYRLDSVRLGRGDLSIFCLYKTLAVPNGGMLVQLFSVRLSCGQTVTYGFYYYPQSVRWKRPPTCALSSTRRVRGSRRDGPT